ncbi:MAG: hypothetical protein KatS3mg024_2746 [Armatimonadota bacterium]|nr:MAG: hypothetical protein KatS3mg024_2746 [Armatimonadota bacterium]
MLRPIGFLMALALTIAAATVAMGGPVVSLNADNLSMANLAQQLSSAAGVTVVADPAAQGQFSGGFNNTPLDQVLSAATKAAGLKWYKVYLPADISREEAAKQAREQVALLQAVQELKSAMVYDPATGTQAFFSRKEEKDEQADEAAAAQGLAPVYYIAGKPAAAASTASAASAAQPVVPAGNLAGAPIVQQYAQMELQRNQAFLQMTPEQRAAALEQTLINEMAMNPSDRQAMARARMEAFRALAQSNSPVWQQYREQRRELWRGMPRDGERDGGRRGDGGGRPQRQQ